MTFLQDRVIKVSHLSVQFRRGDKTIEAVRDLAFHVDRGETLAIVGESGSGKSVTSLALMRLVEHGGGIIRQGRMEFKARDKPMVDIAQLDNTAMRSIRGADMAMVFQEPMTSLNPVFTIGEQIAESIRLHQGLSASAANAEVRRMLDQVRIPDAKSMLTRFPHQLSGGMRQRVMIAMALACKPALLIADEPTTALDVTIQAQILQLIRELQTELEMGVIFITHDMGVVAEVANRVLVMYQGEKVEEGSVEDIFARPRHAYTRALLSAIPRLGAMNGSDRPAPFALVRSDGTPIAPSTAPVSMPDPLAAPILQVKGLTTRFDIRTGILNRVTKRVHAVEELSFELRPGETLALVGESGCGKSTTGRSLLKLVKSQAGQIIFNGKDISALEGTPLQQLRRNIQFIFQDPYASLDPRTTVGYSILEPLLIHNIMPRKAALQRVGLLLERVGLPASAARRYPHEFSGGQRQRICIARALALSPKVVIADESVSALDVSIQAQIVNLLMELQQELGMAYIFISHDMAVVERISHRVAVMYLGQIVEIGPRRAIFENPQHPYTRKLMAAVPVADPTRRQLNAPLQVDEIPSPVRDVGDEPAIHTLRQVGEGHFVAQAAP